MGKLFSLVLLGLGAAALVWAGPTAPAPEIDPASGASALTLLAGTVLLIRNKSSKH